MSRTTPDSRGSTTLGKLYMDIGPPDSIPEGINPILFEAFHIFCTAERWLKEYARHQWKRQWDYGTGQFYSP